MGALSFYDWLTTKKNMSVRSAKDVLSRCKRIEKILSIDTIDGNTAIAIQENEEFAKLSMFIKSQLKRAIALQTEYKESCK